jgi:hypothetical protein
LSNGSDVNYYRFRLILTRNGIIRHETVTSRIEAGSR